MDRGANGMKNVVSATVGNIGKLREQIRNAVRGLLQMWASLLTGIPGLGQVAGMLGGSGGGAGFNLGGLLSGLGEREA